MIPILLVSRSQSSVGKINVAFENRYEEIPFVSRLTCFVTSTNRQSIARNVNFMEIKERKHETMMQKWYCQHQSLRFSSSPGSSLITSNKSFNPRSFLLQVHKDTSYEDLVVGLQRLNVTIDQRSDALKSLVHSNFDRFVSAKNTIDHIHDEMRSKNLNEQEEYGTKKLHGYLIGAQRVEIIHLYFFRLLNHFSFRCECTSWENLWSHYWTPRQSWKNTHYFEHFGALQIFLQSS